VLLPLNHAAKLKPCRCGHAIPASVGIFLVVLQGNFCVLSFHMQLAEFDGGLEVRLNVVLRQ